MRMVVTEMECFGVVGVMAVVMQGGMIMAVVVVTMGRQVLAQ